MGNIVPSQRGFYRNNADNARKEDIVPWFDSWTQFALRPWAGEAGDIDAPDSIVSFFMEFFACFLLGWFVNMVKAVATAGSAAQNGFFIGAVYAAVFYAAWQWTVAGWKMRRHMNWAISLCYFLGTHEIGLVAFICYAGIQIGAAAAAGGVLGALGVATVPDITAAATATTAPMAKLLIWFGSFMISMSVLYNDKEEQVGENERENSRRTGAITALVILFLVTGLFQFQCYSFGNVVYFAGFVGKGATANVNTGFDLAWLSYLFMPLAGSGTAMFVFWFTRMIYGAMRGPSQPNDVPNSEMRIKAYYMAPNASYASSTQITAPYVSAPDLRRRTTKQKLHVPGLDPNLG
jgi:hypothetical protein